MRSSSLPFEAVIQRRCSFAVLEAPRERAQDAVERCGCGAQLLLEPRHGLGEARRRERLHHVVDRALVEGGHRVGVVRGHERDVAAAVDLLRDLEAAHAGHLDVEEQHVGPVLLDRVQRGDTFLGLRADRQFRPQRGQFALQLRTQNRLVFGDHRLRRGHPGISIMISVPRSARLRRSSRASASKSVCRCSRTRPIASLVSTSEKAFPP